MTSRLPSLAATANAIASRGIAVELDGSLVFGMQAEAHARLLPLVANSTFWQRLDAEPLPRAIGGARNNADLVFWHLKTLAEHADEAMVVVVPAGAGADQLGVLLGIAQEAGMPIGGFVPLPAIAGSVVPSASGTRVLDLQRHRALLSTLSLDDGKIAVDATEDMAGFGIAHVLDGWINVVADRFINDTRFDPLHSAHTEQQVHDQVTTWWRSADASAPLRDYPVQIERDGDTRRLTFSQDLLREKLAQRLQPVLERLSGADHLVVPETTIRLPGMKDVLESAGLQVDVASSADLIRGVVTHKPLLLDPSSPRLVTRLPALATRDQPAQDAASSARVAPTHVLCMHGEEPLHQAVPIAPGVFGLPVQAEGSAFHVAASADLVVNGTPGSGLHRLASGDRVRTRGAEYLVFRLLE